MVTCHLSREARTASRRDSRHLENSDIDSEFSRWNAPMLPRTDYPQQLESATARSPITDLLGITIPAAAMRRFWTMLAHWHGQTWNASELGRAMALTDKTVRRYLDLLTGTYMVRQLQPWFENAAKRQVKAPKVYLRDPGLLHTLLDIHDDGALLAHPRVGASWEGFVIEQILRAVRPSSAWFWAAHGAGELDLLVFDKGRRIGFEVKFSEAPVVTKAMRNVSVC